VILPSRRRQRKFTVALPPDDKPNHDHEPDDEQQAEAADDLIAGETHLRRESVHPGQLNSGVVGLQNLFDVQALLGQAVRAKLAHAHAVAPAASREDE